MASCDTEKAVKKSACCQFVALIKAVFGYDIVTFDKSNFAEAIPFSSGPTHRAKLEHALSALGRAGLSDKHFLFSTSTAYASCFSNETNNSSSDSIVPLNEAYGSMRHRRGKGQRRRGQVGNAGSSPKLDGGGLLSSVSISGPVASNLKDAQSQGNAASIAKSAQVLSYHSKTKRPIFFMHLHKVAGTTLCLLAVNNGHRAAGMKQDDKDPKTKEKFGFNCNILGDDPGHLGLGVQNQRSTFGQAEGLMTCKLRRDKMVRQSWTFSAIERWIFPQEVCPDQFIYMTCLRDPLARIKSAMKFHRRQTESKVLSWATKNKFNAAAPIATGTPAVNNFYVRSFAGKAAYLKPLGDMNEQDLALATALINQFEIVLILEHFDRDLVQLQKLLGWNIKYLGQAKKSGSGGKQISFTSAQETLIKQRNTLDYEFYSHACSLAEEISTKVRRSNF